MILNQVGPPGPDKARAGRSADGSEVEKRPGRVLKRTRGCSTMFQQRCV